MAWTDRLCKETALPALSTRFDPWTPVSKPVGGTNPPHLRNSSRQLLDSFQAQWSPVSDMLIRRRQPQSALCYLDVSATALLQALSLSFRKLAQGCTFPYFAKLYQLVSPAVRFLLAKSPLSRSLPAFQSLVTSGWKIIKTYRFHTRFYEHFV